METSESIWTAFWAGLGARQGGCLPNAPDVHAAVSKVWTDFARSLPRRARVIDLCSGNGPVLVCLRQARRDLQLVGVDSAAKLPPSPPGIKLKAGTDIAELPFGAESFDAATSQFGFEYTDMEASSAELFRVLRRGGGFAMIAHDSSSTLLGDNRERAAALRWFRGTGLLDQAKRLLRARLVASLPTPPSFAQAVWKARELFPDMPVAEELCFALVQILQDRPFGHPEDALAEVNEIDRRTGEELALLQELDRAGLGEDQADAVTQSLAGIGFAMDPPRRLTTPRGPLAWRISGAKPN